MKSLILSNFNLLKENSIWKNLIDFQNYHFDDYNNIYFTLNNSKKIKDYQNFYFIIYINDLINEKKSLGNLVATIKKIAKINYKKKFYLFFLKNKIENDFIDQKNILYFYQSFKSLDKTLPNFKFNEIITYSRHYNLRNFYLLRFPLEMNAIKLIIREINKQNVKKLNSYKLIILDCDNTLWDGIVGEDGVNSITYGEDGIGKIFEDIQKHLKFLKQSGIMLSISSKNNEGIIWQTFKKRQMILKKNDFIYPQINWFPKEKNIKKIIQRLSLRNEDVIFIDDNIIEIKKVKSNLKGINVYKIDDIIEYLKFIRTDKRLQTNYLNNENKNKQYEIRERYEKLKENNPKNIFKNLNQRLYFCNVNSKNFNRALQLFNKTNQFNFTSRRLNSEELDTILKDKNKKIQLIKFSDKFGDHGIIGLYVIKTHGNSKTIQDFIISCRVINRKIEEFILLKILLKNKKKNKIFINFRETLSNTQLINNFLQNSFFVLKSDSKKIKKYELILNEDLKNVKNFFKK